MGRRSLSVLDDHLDAATEVGEGLAGDEAPGKRFFRKLRHPFDDPRGPIEDDVADLVIRGPGGGGDDDALGSQPHFEGLLAPRAAADFVVEGGPVEGDLASTPRGEPSAISLIAWRLLQLTEDYKALAMSGLLARRIKVGRFLIVAIMQARILIVSGEILSWGVGGEEGREQRRLRAWGIIGG